MSTDAARKGSLAWRKNAQQSLRTKVPVVDKKCPYSYYVKVGMDQEIFNDRITPITIVKEIPLEKKQKGKFLIKYSELKVKRNRKKDSLRQINAADVEEIRSAIEKSRYVDVVSYTKGKGTEGPVRACNLSLGLRKAKNSNSTRRPGSMGLRGPGKIVPTKPFAKKIGNSRRTTFNMEIMAIENISNLCAHRYFSKEGKYLKIKGSIPGIRGATLALRPALRKQKVQ